MTLHRRRAAACAGLCLLAALPLTAAQIDHQSTDQGGGRSASVSYANLGSVGSLGGLATGVESGTENRAGFAARLNEAPRVPARVFERPANQALKISLSDLSLGITDAEGETFVVESVASVSTGGVSVSREGGWLFYEATPSAPASDTVRFLVADSLGDKAEASFTITVATGPLPGPSLTLLRIVPLDGAESFRVSFVGIPGRLYRVEVAPDVVNGPWTTLSDGVAGADGLYSVLDTPPLGQPARYYRSVRR